MIDEKKLIEVMERWKRGGIEEHEQSAFNLAIDLIKIQPKVGEWIPCNERLPEDNQAVLTCKNKQISILIWKSERRIWLEPKGNWWWSYCMVEKWQPLPEPYSSGN